MFGLFLLCSHILRLVVTRDVLFLAVLLHTQKKKMVVVVVVAICRSRSRPWKSSSQRSFGQLVRGSLDQVPDPAHEQILSPPSVRTSVPVAVHSILVATVGLRVLWQGFLGEGVASWRVPLPGFAARRVRGSAPMSWSGTWIFCLQPPWTQKTRSCCRWSVSIQMCTTGG